jgi:beta-lactamase regulating signal transducer with metallopeptidase domain
MREYFDPEWTEYLFGTLFTAAWQAAILVLVTSAASQCARRAASRCTIWTACIVGLAVVPVVSLLLPHCYLFYQSSAEPLHFPTHIPRPACPPDPASDIWTLADGSRTAFVCRTLLYAWMIGAALAFGRLLWSWVSMTRLLRRVRPCRDQRVHRIMRRLSNLAVDVTVLELDGLVGAICWQIHGAKIILPTDTTLLAEHELEMMIRHELAHLRRSDPGMLFLQRLVEVAYWYHPLVWWATLKIAKYREFACDDLVVNSGHEPTEYAKCLGQLAMRYYALLPQAPAGLGIVWSQHVVLLRVKRLLAWAKLARDPSRAQRTCIVLAGAALMCFVSLVRIDCSAIGAGGRVGWTPWPTWSSGAVDALGIQLRDFPLDAHRYDASQARESCQLMTAPAATQTRPRAHCEQRPRRANMGRPNVRADR